MGHFGFSRFSVCLGNAIISVKATKCVKFSEEKGSIILRKKLRVAFITRRALPVCIAVVVVAVCCFLHVGTGAYAVYYNQSGRKIPIYSVEREDKKIAITFDCAWGTERTDELLKIMSDYGVKCTFFATQFWVEKYPDYVRKIVGAGHEMGTHSATHSHMSRMSGADIEAELSSSKRAIEDITGEGVILFRAPFGEYDDQLLNLCEKGGLYTIQWDVDSLDWKDVTAAEISNRIIKRVKNGSIILCHNNAVNTPAALPHVFADLMGRGYEFVRVSELIYKDGFTVDANGVQRPTKSL